MAELIVSEGVIKVGDEVVCDNRFGTVEEITGLDFGNHTDDLSVRIALKDGGSVLLQVFYGDVKKTEKGMVFYFQEASWYSANKQAATVSRAKQ